MKMITKLTDLIFNHLETPVETNNVPNAEEDSAPPDNGQIKFGDYKMTSQH